MKIKNKLYIFVLNMMLQESDKLWLIDQQNNQIAALILKLENL